MSDSAFPGSLRLGEVLPGGSALKPTKAAAEDAPIETHPRPKDHPNALDMTTLVVLLESTDYILVSPPDPQHHPNPTRPMASAEHLKALLRSHLEGDNDRFISVAMHVAAHEARLGHGKLATDLRDIIDQAKKRRGAGSTVPISQPRGELATLLEASYPKSRLGDMILGETLADRIKRVIREQRHAGRILEHGLSPRRKLLLVGAPGTGKTLTASGELGLPLLRVRLDGLITRFMGETARPS